MADIQKLNVNSTTYDISTTWSKVTGKPSTFTPSSHTHDYLPLSGGTIDGILTIDSSSKGDNPLSLVSNKTDANGACRIQFLDSNDAFQAYVMTGWGNLILSHRSYNQLGVGDSGIWCSSDNGTTKYSLVHSGNIGSYALPISGGTCTGSITATAFYQGSDERLKTFHDPIKVDLEKLKTLRKNYFKFNDKDKLEIGVSAQEIQQLYPEIVSTNDEGYLSVAYDKLSVIALKAVDELNDINDKQQKEIDDLKDQLSTIKNILKEKGIL